MQYPSFKLNTSLKVSSAIHRAHFFYTHLNNSQQILVIVIYIMLRYMLCEKAMLVVEHTAQVAEVTAESILSDCRQSEVVEARMIAIKILSDMGYSAQRLAKYFRKTEPGVRRILSTYDYRSAHNVLVFKMTQQIRNKLESK